MLNSKWSLLESKHLVMRDKELGVGKTKLEDRMIEDRSSENISKL